MTIKEEIRDNIAILYLKGNMMGGPESMEVHEKVKSLLGDDLAKIVIDLSKVKWMNSSGLGALTSGLLMSFLCTILSISLIFFSIFGSLAQR